VPVDRSNSRGIVGSMVEHIKQAKARNDFFWLALAPEGTRRYQAQWRTGFYQLVTQADVPVGLVFFDYGKKRVGVNPFFRLSGDPGADLAAIAAAYAGVTGKRADQAAPIKIRQG
jgi:1-acyl-sn-glycerol-3-phosphate acyltransferase